MKSKLLLFLALLLITQSVAAYPISPRTLRKLLKESELVVWAKVVAIKEIEGKTYFDEAKALLVVQEQLQGSVSQDTLAVHFSPGMICPAPARYEEGTQVLAFLGKNKHGGGYYTHALSYGSKTLETEDYLVYKRRIIEMQNIQLMDEGEAKNALLLDWFVNCATHPATRWEGTYELSALSDFMSFYDQDEEGVRKQYELLDYHKLALAEALFATEDLSHEDMGLIDLIIHESGEQVLNFLVGQLRKADLEKMWIREAIMGRIVYLTDRGDLRKIMEQLAEIDYFDKEHQEKSLALAREFVQKLG